MVQKYFKKDSNQSKSDPQESSAHSDQKVSILNHKSPTTPSSQVKTQNGGQNNSKSKNLDRDLQAIDDFDEKLESIKEKKREQLKKISQKTPVSPSSNVQPSEPEQRLKEKKEKSQNWERLELRSGTSTFKPIAAEYPPEIEVLKDPTGNLFVEGGIDDFLSVQIDKFEKLKKILNKRPEGNRTINIDMINRLSNSTEVDFVGMVIEKRRTRSQNYLLQMEDPTGTLAVLITEDKKELFDKMKYVLEDHVLMISGYLNINPERKSRIVLAKEVYFPDTKSNHDIRPTQDGLAICLISDTHFGSIDWLDKVWGRFVDYLNCRVGNDKQMEQAGRVKYVVVAGDIVDGIGVFPNQDKRLAIKDLYDQYEFAAECFAQLPDHISIILTPGDHDVGHKAVPMDAIPEEFAKTMYDNGIHMLGAPALVSMHGIKTEVFHGTPLIEMKKSIPGMDFDQPHDMMKEFVRARHLAPTYGNETEIAPTELDWLALDTIPDILHMGHLHKVGVGSYHGILSVNSGCFQGQTDYMKGKGIVPDFGKPTIVNIEENRLVPKVIDLTVGL